MPQLQLGQLAAAPTGGVVVANDNAFRHLVLSLTGNNVKSDRVLRPLDLPPVAGKH